MGGDLALDADPATALLVELTRRGIELRAHAGRLRFRPPSAMTPELGTRMKAHKSELLAILAGGDRTAPAYTAKGRWLQAEPVATDLARWYTGEPSELLPAGVVDLARPNHGWMPGAWRDWLLYLAGRCEALNPARAGELRQAARLLNGSDICRS